MDHVVYLDAKSKELDAILAGTKRMIIRGAMGRKMPYGRVHTGDVLYFVQNDSTGAVTAAAKVTAVQESEALSKSESAKLVATHQSKLQLTDKQIARWAGKRYIILITIGGADALKPFKIDRGNYGNMDDWLPVGEISSVTQ